MAKKKKKDIDFLLENKHYKRLNVILYLISVVIIVLIYFFTLILFSKFTNFLLTAIASFVIGLYIVINRSYIVKKISEQIEHKKRLKYKENSRHGLKTTLKKITPKRKHLQLNIKSKESIKEKVVNWNFKVKEKITGQKRRKRGYIEIK